MMKYTESKKIKYSIYASIFTMIAYMMRMNTLIFVIATVIYLILNLFKGIKQKKHKEKLIELLIIVAYIAIGYTFNFYIMKIVSMWAENTYAAVNINDINTHAFLENLTNPITFYQKTLLILMSISIIAILIQNRKNLSINIIFLITIFLGGFAFHILWEAKSRYIIPYVVILIPMAAISINTKSLKEKLKIKK